MRSQGRTWGLTGVVASGVILALVGSLQAGLIADGAGAMPGYYGTRTFSSSTAGDTLLAAVDFAVYAPGNYPGADPSLGNDYAYVYQIFADSLSTVNAGFFSVGLTSGSGAHHPGDDVSGGAPGNTGGTTYDLARIGPSSAYWVFDPEIGAGTHSTTLLFTSPFGPTWKSTALADGGLPTPANDLIASPLPEPATLSLLALGGLLALRRRRSK
jgi:hypothetical protein